MTNPGDYTDLEQKIYKHIAENVYNYKGEEDPRKDLKYGPSGVLLKNGSPLGATIDQILEAARTVLPPAATPYLRDIHDRETLFLRCKFMNSAPFIIDGYGNLYSEKTSPWGSEKEISDSGNALYSAAVMLPNKKHVKEPQWTGIYHCPYCWRLTPFSGKRRIRCSVHSNSNSAVTQRDRRRKNIMHVELQGKHQYETNLFYKIYREIVSESKGILRGTKNLRKYENNMLNFHNDLLHNPKNIAQENHNLSDAWFIFNYTGQYAYDLGAVLDDFLSVIKTIDDAHLPSKERDNIHTSFSRAPDLAKKMLTRAEAWLRIQAIENRGGARPGTGGKRPGAGRPHKSTNST